MIKMPAANTRHMKQSGLLMLIFLWAMLTLLNITKAFHIDDTFHLEAAEWIRENPLTPMSGLINWTDSPTPLYSHNQPPLFFYMIALVVSFAGTGEIPLHLFLSIFTFLSLFIFDRLTHLLKIRNSSLLLLLFAFSPALIVNQNLMTDIPLLSLILGSAYFLVVASEQPKTRSYVLAALLLGIGLLIKYSVLPLLVVLILVLIIRRDLRYLTVLLIPMGMLFLWSVWNYTEYGSVHFFDRPTGGLHINRMWSFMAVIGSVCLFTASLFHGSWPFRYVRYVIAAVILMFLALLFLFISGLVSEQATAYILNIGFILNGFFLFFLMIQYAVKYIKASGFRQTIKSDGFIMFLFAGATSAFIMLYAPFMATRHILLILPFVLLFLWPLIEKSGRIINRVSLISTVILGIALGISDYTYAGFYRKMASEIKFPQGTKVWTAGHWGWQWYSAKNGMIPFAGSTSEMNEGDWFVYPGNIPRQSFENSLELTVVEKYFESATTLTFFSGNNNASMYSSSMKIPPWTLSMRPIDTVYICRVVRILKE
ncbi:MAG: hypothetical protein CVT94_12185 [Bacteroidetes bacterium HGW-Bacteroidetes-11]|nr:MAG: hypothetical protein CVT94_12185 [Bacteroidetes bacterium HGW-Bacteroidetes-11]